MEKFNFFKYVAEKEKEKNSIISIKNIETKKEKTIIWTLEKVREYLSLFKHKIDIKLTLDKNGKYNKGRKYFKVECACIDNGYKDEYNPFSEKCIKTDIFSFFKCSRNFFTQIKDFNFIKNNIKLKNIFLSEEEFQEFFTIIRKISYSYSYFDNCILDIIKEIEDENNIEIYWCREKLSGLDFDADGGISEFPEYSAIFLEIYPKGECTRYYRFVNWEPGQSLEPIN